MSIHLWYTVKEHNLSSLVSSLADFLVLSRAVYVGLSVGSIIEALVTKELTLLASSTFFASQGPAKQKGSMQGIFAKNSASGAQAVVMVRVVQ